MTLPYSPSRAVYEGNGAATAFPFAFKVWSTDQLNISITSPKGETSPAQGWTASIGESGGTVTYLHNGAPLPAGWRLAIVRNMPFAQGIDLISASRFDPQVIEDGLDQATAELQQLNEKLARAVIMPATSDKSPEEVVASIYASHDAAAQILPKLPHMRRNRPCRTTCSAAWQMRKQKTPGRMRGWMLRSKVSPPSALP